MPDAPVFLLYAIVFILVLVLNIWYWRERAAMTPEQRKAADDELSNDLLSWWP